MLPGKRIVEFLPCIETGLINLYEWYVTSSPTGPNSFGKSNTTMSYYVEKEYSQLIEVWTNGGFFGNSNKKQKVAFCDVINDNPSVKRTFDSDKKYDPSLRLCPIILSFIE